MVRSREEILREIEFQEGLIRSEQESFRRIAAESDGAGLNWAKERHEATMKGYSDRIRTLQDELLNLNPDIQQSRKNAAHGIVGTWAKGGDTYTFDSNGNCSHISKMRDFNVTFKGTYSVSEDGSGDIVARFGKGKGGGIEFNEMGRQDFNLQGNVLMSDSGPGHPRGEWKRKSKAEITAEQRRLEEKRQRERDQRKYEQEQQKLEDEKRWQAELASKPAPDKGTKKGDVIRFGEYTWCVLDIKNGKALLLSDKIIEMRAYHSSERKITWAECDLRGYLNGEFLNTFSAQDRALILETRIKTKKNPLFRLRTKASKATYDRIYLLSIDELVRFFNAKIKRFGYAEHNAALFATDKAGTGVGWMLRSPGCRQWAVATVLSRTRGHVVVNAHSNHSSSSRSGIRPALWIKLQ